MAGRRVMLCMLILIVPLLSGCWFLFGAAAGGAAGYEVSTDNVKGHFDTSFERAYNVSLKIIKSMGETTMEDKKGGWIKATLEEHEVAVHIEKLTEKTIQVTVSARKYSLPKVQFARNILDKIAKGLK